MTAGLHPQASSGLDTALGEEVHNFEPQGIFDAAFPNINSYLVQYSRKDIQFGHHLVFGSRNFNFHIQPSPDSIVIFEASLPPNIFAEIKYFKKLPYGSVPERKYLGSGNINYQLPKSSLLSYSLFVLNVFIDNVLPVELISFKANTIDDEIHLEWTTATETNNYGFEVQRSISQSKYTTIGFMKGSGTKTTPSTYSFVDKKIVPRNYSYRLKQIDLNGSFKYSEAVGIEIAPMSFSLEQNYPNPFNPSTKIKYTIPSVGTSLMKFVQLKVYDVLGNEVATLVDEYKPAGSYEVDFNGVETRHGVSLPSGVYIYTLRTGDYFSSRKMILLK